MKFCANPRKTEFIFVLERGVPQMASSTKLNEQPIKVNDAEAIQNQHQLQKQADGNYPSALSH